MAPTTRQELIDHCLRHLGHPVIEINVDVDQLEDRVDEAIQYWQTYHSDAIYRDYVKHQITATDITNEYLTPLVTGATLCQQKLGNTIIEPRGRISSQLLIAFFLFLSQST